MFTLQVQDSKTIMLVGHPSVLGVPSLNRRGSKLAHTLNLAQFPAYSGLSDNGIRRLMKKLLAVCLISLGLVSTSVFAENYQTSKHNININCLNYSDCTYQSWNKPKQIGQGKPDLEILDGEPYAGDRPPCGKIEGYEFVKKPVLIQVAFGKPALCESNIKDSNAVGVLYVKSGKRHSTYPLYAK